MPMTLRTLKKRCKQAVPILQKHYPLSIQGELFLADRGENYHGHVIRCTHGSGDPCRVEGRPRCDCTYHPLKGTPMFGGMSGYYEPEWDEKTAYHVLQDAVQWSDRPPTMTDREWRRTLAIARVRPVTDEEMEAWSREALAPADPLAIGAAS